jgi:RNA polymerase sigma factor (sigma-70 family)
VYVETEGIATRAFASAEELLQTWSAQWTGCIMIDIRMPGMNGLQLQEELNNRQSLLPVIVLTGHADVPVAIRAMKQGAFDFLEKPYSDHELMDSARSALELGSKIDLEEHEKNTLEIAFAALTEREREVMCLVVEGNTNKAVASLLGISEKTVEVHRARVMEKTSANSLSELVRMCLLAQG